MTTMSCAYSEYSRHDAGQWPSLRMLLCCRVSIEYQRKQAKAMQKYFRGRSQQVQAEKSQCALDLHMLNPVSCSGRQLLDPGNSVRSKVLATKRRLLHLGPV
jgi:hypothetical protein